MPENHQPPPSPRCHLPRRFVITKRSLQQLREDAEVPASLLPDLEGLWQAVNHSAAGVEGAGGAGTSSSAGAGPSSKWAAMIASHRAFNYILDELEEAYMEEMMGCCVCGCCC